jgi:hypothetical protein
LGIEGNWGAAIFVAAFCLIVVGFLDNVIRTWVLKSDTSLHPLLAFVSVLGGLQVMGLWGVFIGPIVACCLHSLIEIFNTELKAATDLGNVSDTGVIAIPVGGNSSSAVAGEVSKEPLDQSTSGVVTEDSPPPEQASDSGEETPTES